MSEEILIDTREGLGLITLNRPRAINALTHSMVLAMRTALRQWAVDDRVRAVVVAGAGERGLCAGGDIVAIHDDAKNASPGSAHTDCPSARFWRDEYLLNAAIGRYPKPYVAVMDGLVMGGGVGVSAHGSHRIVTERSAVGMPETGIGFVPDVGGTYLLSRAPGEIGTHLALTTARMSAGDALAAGFADHYVPSDRLEAMSAAMRTADPDTVLTRFAQPAPPSELMAQRSWIDACYDADTVEEIVARLRAHASAEANRAAEQIAAKSPVALKVTLRALRNARAAADLETALRAEYRASIAALSGHDLAEGIRAQVIDKDRTPHWCPATLAEVADALVESYGAALGDHELPLVASELDPCGR